MADVGEVAKQPAPERDCVDCGAKIAMKLQNVAGVRLTLLYVCCA
jgi:hypothetical protein